MYYKNRFRLTSSVYLGYNRKEINNFTIVVVSVRDTEQRCSHTLKTWYEVILLFSTQLFPFLFVSLTLTHT